jgi:hypothetical protein
MTSYGSILVVTSINGLYIFDSDSYETKVKATPVLFSSVQLIGNKLWGHINNTIYLSHNYGDTWDIIKTFEINIKSMFNSKYTYVLHDDGSVISFNYLNKFLISNNVLRDDVLPINGYLGYDFVTFGKLFLTPGTWVISYTFSFINSYFTNTVISHYLKEIDTNSEYTYYSLTNTIFNSIHDKPVISESILLTFTKDTQIIIGADFPNVHLDYSNNIDYNTVVSVDRSSTSFFAEKVLIRKQM